MRALSLIFVLLAAAYTCSAQTVYSIQAYSMGRVHEHDWSIGCGSARFGFDQYRQYQDASGQNLYAFSDVTTKGVATPRYTTVFLGPFHFTVPGPAWIVALVVAAGFASVFLLIAMIVGWVRRSHTHAHQMP